MRSSPESPLCLRALLLFTQHWGSRWWELSEKLAANSIDGSMWPSCSACSTNELGPKKFLRLLASHPAGVKTGWAVFGFRRFSSQLSLWWAGQDLNLRRRCRQIYSLLPLATRAPTPICNSYGFRNCLGYRLDSLPPHAFIRHCF